MSAAPNRAFEVHEILATLPVAAKTPTDDGRRANLFTIIRRLNRLDDGKWGALLKTNENGKVPGDIIVWEPTMEHFDVITGDGLPAWIPDGVLTFAPWRWLSVGIEAGPIPPQPTPDGPDPFVALAATLAKIQATLDKPARKPPRYQGKLFGYTITLEPV